jgi:hypothetical protein
MKKNSQVWKRTSAHGEKKSRRDAGATTTSPDSRGAAVRLAPLFLFFAAGQGGWWLVTLVDYAEALQCEEFVDGFDVARGAAD